MQTDRRRLISSLPSLLAASLAPSFLSPLVAAKPQLRAALLVPLTGDHAALGRSMERAAMLAQGDSEKNALLVFDTAGTAQGAAIAAQNARKSRAAIILGPVFEREVAAVLGAVPRTVPVVSFSNNSALVDSGAFVFGITARQAASAILRYAAGIGVRRLAIGGTDTGWGQQALAAVNDIAKQLNLEVVALPAAGGELPTAAARLDAVLMTDLAALARVAPAARGLGLKMLGMAGGIDLPPETFRALDGALIAAPDPAGFAAFARTFENRYGSPPGAIAGLAYDAVNAVRQMRLGGGIDRSALLSANGFKGVCGDTRFREDGSVARALAVLEIADGALRTAYPGSIG